MSIICTEDSEELGKIPCNENKINLLDRFKQLLNDEQITQNQFDVFKNLYELGLLAYVEQEFEEKDIYAPNIRRVFKLKLKTLYFLHDGVIVAK